MSYRTTAILISIVAIVLNAYKRDWVAGFVAALALYMIGVGSIEWWYSREPK